MSLEKNGLETLESIYLAQPAQKIFFDCDGTLSLIEGIDVIAEQNGVGQEVSAITQKCMSELGMNPMAYQQRLDMVKPTLKQINALSSLYIKHISPGAKEVIECLLALKKEVFILSAGIKAAILPFAHYLGIPEKNILAVNVYFDDNESYVSFDGQCHLVYQDGKSKQISAINYLHPGLSVLIGDGVSDLEAQHVVSRFIGYGGLSIKERVRQQANFYLSSPNLMPLLCLCLTQGEHQQLKLSHPHYYQESLVQLERGQLMSKEG